MSRTTFQTRARTIDHLGRGQIADCPTAVSELWKNAYDAGATKVSLHIFDGTVPIAAIFDDGIGMAEDDFLERWLIIGTESKVEDSAQNSETAGRARQGEKGIGRLSAAFLAPITLIVSKKEDDTFAAAMVDWRLFENPYLSLGDIAVAVETFDAADEIFDRLPGMFATLRANVDPPKGYEGRDTLIEAWKRFDKHEEAAKIHPKTSDRIRSDTAVTPSKRHLVDWPVFSGGSARGTAILLLNVHRELALHVETSASDEDAEVKEVKEDLIKTLTGFTDPFVETRDSFGYDVVAHIGTRRVYIVRDADVFSLEEFRSLEHTVEGEFDDSGIFRGKLRVFGIDRGEITHVPRRPPPKGSRERLGPFKFCIGSFEVDPGNSTHNPAVHGALMGKAEQFGGMYLYRDHLRVMPYGNPDSDLFGLEERRSRHAGRYFWSHRRSFGRTEFTRSLNPNLRDKAGREGLVDNRAFRELRLLVIDLLVTVGRRYFGTDSDIRKDELPGIEARNKAAKEAASKANRGRARKFRSFLKEKTKPLADALQEAAAMRTSLGEAISAGDSDAIAVAPDRLDALRTACDTLRPPPLPSKLGDEEGPYRKYRDDLRALNATVETLSRDLSEAIEKLDLKPADEVAALRLSSNQSRVNAKVERYRRTIDGQLNDLREKWKMQAESDFKKYYLKASPVLSDIEKGVRLATVLNILDSIASELDEDFAGTYEPFLRTLEQLRNDIDLEGALAVTEDERAQLDRRVNDFNVLAQMGIAVEIIGHELDTMDAEVRRNLNRLPSEVRKSDAFTLAYEAHRAMSDRLRFLAPLRIAGYRSREKITGDQIADFLLNFFQKRIRDERVAVDATAAFRGLAVNDLRSRIFPVFINLINNALYWIRFSEDRRITLDLVDDLVVVADSGPGVDEHDVSNLFDIFFTRRTNGRGVGLHLCKLNLAASHHTIRYAGADDPHVLPGANFIIEFRGLTRD